MDKKGLVQVVKEMIAAPSCYKDLQKIGQEWVDAVGTDKEKAAPKSSWQKSKRISIRLTTSLNLPHRPKR